MVHKIAMAKQVCKKLHYLVNHLFCSRSKHTHTHIQQAKELKKLQKEVSEKEESEEQEEDNEDEQVSVEITPKKKDAVVPESPKPIVKGSAVKASPRRPTIKKVCEDYILFVLLLFFHQLITHTYPLFIAVKTPMVFFWSLTRGCS